MYTKPASFSTWVLRNRLRPLSSCSKHFTCSDLPALGWHQDKRLSFHSPEQTAEFPQAWEAKEGRVPQGSRAEYGPTEKSALGKHPGGKERLGSRKWVSSLSFLNCFSSSCDPEAQRELQGYKTRAECAERNSLSAL